MKITPYILAICTVVLLNSCADEIMNETTPPINTNHKKHTNEERSTPEPFNRQDTIRQIDRKREKRAFRSVDPQKVRPPK